MSRRRANLFPAQADSSKPWLGAFSFHYVGEVHLLLLNPQFSASLNGPIDIPGKRIVFPSQKKCLCELRVEYS